VETFKQYLKDKANFTEEQSTTALKYVEFKHVKKGEYLLQKGTVCETAFFVESGLLYSFIVDDNQKEQVLQFAPEGWIVSDRSSMLLNEPSELYIKALEETTVILLNNNFTQMAKSINPSYTKYYEAALHKHIHQLQKRIISLMADSAEKRYLKFVDTYYNITLRVPQHMIASYLGITPEGLSRVRRELANKH
jgi:CRP-like cAMP-binding protein